MKWALLVIADGRDEYLKQTIFSASKMLPAPDHFVFIDDSAHELGFAGAIQRGWDRVLQTDAEYVFHLEQDFTFNRPVPLEEMARTLQANPHLVQLALLRQPWNKQEKRAGGIVQMHPEDYVDKGGWLEHTRNFTTNPSLYPRWVASRGWPQRSESEGHFGLDLIREYPDFRFAYWGDGSEWVTHIGDERIGCGY